MVDVKKPRCCSQCDKVLFEDVGTPHGRRVILTDKDSVRLGLVLTTGSLTDMAMCSECVPDLKLLWRKNMTAFSFETNHENRNAIAALAHERPLGELYRERLEDVIDARLD